MALKDKFKTYAESLLVSPDTPEEYQAIIYKYLGDEDKANALLKHIITYGMPQTRYGNMADADKKDYRSLIDLARYQIFRCIYWDLARVSPEKAKQCFEWAADNSIVDGEFFKVATKNGYFDEIAVGYLWRSYALIVLCKYREAYDLLKQVPYYFNKHKLSGVAVWQVYEPNLVKALLPLCEYKLNPVQENREKARQGLEDFIKSFREPKFRLEALLYYYHLKEMFPEVYADSGKRPGKPAAKPQPSPVTGLSPADLEGKGAVVVSDPTGYLNIFGTPKDLVQFVQKVSSTGEYPLLSRLLDYYNMENTPGIDPADLEDECVRLLEQTDDAWLREKVEPLLDVAREAQQDEGENIVLYLDPDIPMS